MKVLLSIIGFIAAIGMVWMAFIVALDLFINRPWRKLKIKRNKYDFD